MGRMEEETCESLNGGCIMRKVVSEEVTAGGRLDFFLDSEFNGHLHGFHLAVLISIRLSPTLSPL